MSDPNLNSSASARQWEAHVRRMVVQGIGREQILYSMTDANWPYENAIALVRRVAKKERTKAIAMLVGGLAITAFSAVVTFVSFTSSQGGMILYGPAIVGIAMFCYGLTRVVRIKA